MYGFRQTYRRHNDGLRWYSRRSLNQYQVAYRRQNLRTSQMEYPDHREIKVRHTQDKLWR